MTPQPAREPVTQVRHPNYIPRRLHGLRHLTDPSDDEITEAGRPLITHLAVTGWVVSSKLGRGCHRPSDRHRGPRGVNAAPTRSPSSCDASIPRNPHFGAWTRLPGLPGRLSGLALSMGS
jgi:hypothetical protein